MDVPDVSELVAAELPVGNKTKSTPEGRVSALRELLDHEDFQDEVLPRQTLLEALRDEFEERFGMLPDGARKVAGDTVGGGKKGHGLKAPVYVTQGKPSVFFYKRSELLALLGAAEKH